MGDIANWTNDCMQEAYPSWMPVGHPGYLRRDRNRTVCKGCGSTDVHWREVDQGWRLFDNQRQHPGNRYVEHTCAHAAPNADGFEDVPE